MIDPEKRRYLLEDPRVIRGLIAGGLIALSILLVVDIAIEHPVRFVKGGLAKGEMVHVESWPGFYAVYGFAASAAFVLVAKAIGPLLKRKDTYYDGG